MNQAIVDEIYRKYVTIRNNCSLDKKLFTYKRVMLFKEYMDYKEELTDLFISLPSCYLSNIKEECPSASCSECCSIFMYQYLLTHLNKYAEEVREEVREIEPIGGCMILRG